MGLMDRLTRKKPSGATGLFADVQGSSDAAASREVQAGAGGKLKSAAQRLAASTDALPRAKPSKAAKPSGLDARPAELVGNDNSTVVLAFGMRWRTMVKAGGGRDAAQEMAGKAKATHYLMRSHQLGYTQLPKGLDTPVYPAALLAAKSHAGTGLFLLTLEPGTYWLALVRNGQPTNSDEILAGLTEVAAVARARQLSSQFENESITVFTDIRNAGLDGQRDFAIVDLFDTARSDADRLLKVALKRGSIPKPLMAATAVLVLLLGAQHAYKEYRATQARKLAMQNNVVQLTPEQAWQPVYDQWLSARSAPNLTPLVEVRRALVALPVLWHGWTLAGARCQAAASLGEDAKRTWSCTASYERPRVAITSMEMRSAVAVRYPKHAISFPTLSSMQVSWGLSHEASKLTLKDLSDPAELALEVSSVLQVHLPTLAVIPEFAMAPVDLPQPKQQDGTPIPKPPGWPALFKGDVTLRGPLRSLDVVASKLPFVDWSTVGLVVDVKASPTQKSISASALTVELTGAVYGKK